MIVTQLSHEEIFGLLSALRDEAMYNDLSEESLEKNLALRKKLFHLAVELSWMDNHNEPYPPDEDDDPDYSAGLFY